MVELLATNPAKLFGLYPRKGTLAVGSDADIVVFDPNKQVTISAATHHSKVDYNLYEGTEVVGSPELVLLRGNVLVENDELVAAARDRPVRRAREVRRAARRRRSPMRRELAAFGVAVALISAPTAAASVALVTVTSPALPGNAARLVAKVSPGATCSIVVDYKSGPSHAQGLTPDRAIGGIVSWSWIVGTRTTPGRWGIVVSCGSAGTLRTSFAVS